MAKHEITLTVSNGTVVATPFPIPPTGPGDEVIYKIEGASLNAINLIVGGVTPKVKVAVLDTQGNMLPWPDGKNGVNIQPPPPPPGGVRISV